jgi:DnaJ-class molecular chaperone
MAKKEMRDCPTCYGTGEEKGDCTFCNGTGHIPVRKNGKLTTERCTGCNNGKVTVVCSDCRGQRQYLQ